MITPCFVRQHNMAVGHFKMNATLLALLHIALFGLSGFVQAYPECTQTSAAGELDRHDIGDTSKDFIKVLEKFQNKPAEIVFVLDSSGSVGLGNFGCEVQFVRHFSKLFSVSPDNSRMAVVTYSGCGQVFTDLDYIASPVGKNKCTLLGNDLPGVYYRAGGTCTVGGLRRAQEILAQSRQSTPRVVFVLTDGQSNDGGTPLDIAKAMRDSGIIIFAVGLGTGISVDELNGIASTPTDDHVFLLSLLTDVESLAKKVGGDEGDMASWDRNVTPALCDSECTQGTDCCDEHATCSCATQTGSYGCACHPGYRGGGKIGECEDCPRGTYKPQYGNQACEPCPDLSTTAVGGRTTLDACECLPGHEGNPKSGAPCTPISCDRLRFSSASGVVVVPPNCGNNFGIECRLQCKENYRANPGTVDKLQCLASGLWSAEPLQCTRIQCEILPQPNDGILSCDTTDRSIGTVCNLTCSEGYEREGSLQTRCDLNGAQKGGEWSTEAGRCKAKTCPILLAKKNMKIEPIECDKQISKYRKDCFYSCKDGFELRGVNLRTCQADGQWSEPSMDNECVDIEPPVWNITCPDDISLPTEKNKKFVNNPADWVQPVAQDNAGEPVIEASTSATQERFYLDQVTMITYTARDEAGLETTCTFSITVTDEEAPRVISCPDALEVESSSQSTEVFWEEPVFKDNSEVLRVPVISNHESGSTFYWGQPILVWYEAYDIAGNAERCEFTVAVKQYKCPAHPPPQNGALACDSWLGGQFCRVSCNEHFDFSRDPEEVYYCRNTPGSDKSNWGPSPLSINAAGFKMPWPQCSKMGDPSLQVGLELQFFTGDCSVDNDEIKEDFFSKFQKFSQIIPGFCSVGCALENVVVHCSPVEQTARRRRRQTNNVLSIEFTIKVEALELQAQTDTQSTSSPDRDNSVSSVQVLDSFMDAMDSVIATGQLNLTTRDGAALSPAGPMNVVRTVELSCQHGEVLRNNSCVVCPAGTYYDHVEGGICQDCSIDFYQDKVGQLVCQQCPTGTSTQRTNAMSLQDCKEPCPKGTYSSSGLKTCKACPIGTYQPTTGSFACLQCPDGLTTWTEGASSQEDCTGECPFGTYSGTGFFPCSPCPKGTYQPRIAQTSCITCPDGLYTHYEGAHALGYCQVINECESRPCSFGGQCVDLPVGYQCVCSIGYTGPDCFTNINDCGHDLCLNDGTCVDLVAGYHCECAAGFQGRHCQEDIDECESNPCFNRAVCTDLPNSYSCECAPGFTGDFCEVNFFDCASQPCQNDGTCVDLPQNFTCCCPPGYRGRLCETPVDRCDSSPCMNNATCVAGFNSASCTCLQGFTGQRCEVEIDECTAEQVICQHGGTCQDLVNGFKCTCYPGYAGPYCETALLSDFDLNFPTAGTSNYVLIQDGMPGLYALTVTFWMRTSDSDNAGTPLSYAAYNADGTVEDNALTFSDYNSLAIIINGEFMYTDVKLGDGNWHHVAVTWAGLEGNWALYVDGSDRRSGSGFKTGTFIRGSGALVLGQEQDSFAGSFAQTQAFVGDLTQLNMWDYAMTQDEIMQTYSSCALLGNVVTWSMVAPNIHGAINISPASQRCQDITNCQSSTCLNGGICTDLVNAFKCRCALGFHGSRCELMTTSCIADMCLNGGSCHINGSSLSCSCTSGYSGERCEIWTDSCQSIPCLHGATCVSEESLPKCNCPPGFTGQLCEYDVDECNTENGGCEQNCNNTFGSYLCLCAEGYALQDDAQSCKDVSYCTHEGRFYLADTVWNSECSTCHCNLGTAVCEVVKCAELECKENEYQYEAPGACCPECLPESKTCSVSTRGKHITYDGNTYDNTGNCRYVLSQDCVGSQFSIEVQYVANKKKLFRRTLFLRLDCITVEVGYDGSVKVTDVPVELPYIHAAPMNVMVTRTNSSIDEDAISIKTNRGIVVRWSKHGNIEVSAPGTFKGSLCGLCGNMNGNRKDDRMTRQFLPSRSAMEFAHSWKVDGYRHCSVPNVRALTRRKFGAISINNIPVCAGKSFFVLKDIRKKCSLLRQRSFQMCHSVVNPTRYFEWCMQDACSCHSNEPCYCEAIAAYILECQRNLVAIAWAEDSACNVRCPEGMIYDHCGPTCLATCLNPYPDTAECLTAKCVPRCQCPAGTVLQGGNCVLPKYCPAITKTP